MFVGHGLLAFAVVAAVARRRGVAPQRALWLGVVAGLFGTLPDVDVLFALWGLVATVAEAGTGIGVDAAHDTFWTASHEFHRAVTHSLLVGAAATVAVTAWRAGRDHPGLGWAGLAVLGGLLGAGWLAGGPLAAGMLVPLVVGALALARLAGGLGYSPRELAGAAGFGLLSHPFGDLLTGDPPALLYPAEWQVLTERLVVHPDPTLHLLAAFFVELATLWAALLVFARLRGYRLPDLPGLVRPRAGLGVAYGGAVLAVPAPTVEVSYQFVFSVLSVGAVGLPARRRDRREPWLRTAGTALAAVTLAALSYAGAYLLVLA